MEEFVLGCIKIKFVIRLKTSQYYARKTFQFQFLDLWSDTTHISAKILFLVLLGNSGLVQQGTGGLFKYIRIIIHMAYGQIQLLKIVLKIKSIISYWTSKTVL